MHAYIFLKIQYLFLYKSFNIYRPRGAYVSVWIYPLIGLFCSLMCDSNFNPKCHGPTCVQMNQHTTALSFLLTHMLQRLRRSHMCFLAFSRVHARCLSLQFLLILKAIQLIFISTCRILGGEGTNICQLQATIHFSLCSIYG